MLLQLALGSFIALSFFDTASCGCYDPSPAFPPPQYHESMPKLRDALAKIKTSLEDITSQPNYDTSSFSLEITSSKKTLFSLFHTAKEKNSTRCGAATVGESSTYRIASITKVYTILGILQLQVSGKLNLDDTLDKFVPELKNQPKGALPWHDITLRALGSQLSGIPRDLLQSDLINSLPDPVEFGLPPVSRKGLPDCDEYSDFARSCEKKDLIEQLMGSRPLFAPAQQPTYSNIAFELLGLVIEKVTGKTYTEYIHSMLKDMDIHNTTFTKPNDKVAVIPKNQGYYWDVDEGIQNPTGGLYSSSSDLSKFLRYILTHYNGITIAALNWLHPASYSSGVNSFFGMPWEIFRTDQILSFTRRPVTFVTKSGGLPGYSSLIILLPEYDLGITILVGGKGKLLKDIRQIVTAELVPATEMLAQKNLHRKYAGTYTASKNNGINSSLKLSHSPSSGLYVSAFISNGTDVLTALIPQLAGSDGYNPADWRLQVVPTLLFAQPKKQAGEIWRALLVPQNRGRAGIWDEFCINDIDTGVYAGKPINEFVFWTNKESKVEKTELTGFKVTLEKVSEDQDALLTAKRLPGSGIGVQKPLIKESILDNLS